MLGSELLGQDIQPLLCSCKHSIYVTVPVKYLIDSDLEDVDCAVPMLMLRLDGLTVLCW